MRICLNCQGCGLCDWARKEHKRELKEITEKINKLVVKYCSEQADKRAKLIK